MSLNLPSINSIDPCSITSTIHGLNSLMRVQWIPHIKTNLNLLSHRMPNPPRIGNHLWWVNPKKLKNESTLWRTFLSKRSRQGSRDPWTHSHRTWTKSGSIHSRTLLLVTINPKKWTWAHTMIMAFNRLPVNLRRLKLQKEAKASRMWTTILRKLSQPKAAQIVKRCSSSHGLLKQPRAPPAATGCTSSHRIIM